MEITLNVHVHLPPVLLEFLERQAVNATLAEAVPPLPGGVMQFPAAQQAQVTSAEAPRKKRGPKPIAEAAPAAEQAPAAAEQAPTPVAPAAKALTGKDLSILFQETVQLVGLPKASTVFTKFKAGRFLDVKVEDYPAFAKYLLDLQEQFKTEKGKP